eukprot:GHVT01023262.1.p2 GENE.GHVT01023262.1~~GHVT01023262.1.p2  ORF type:complete len:106 (-),score=11.11 GHVT01023262.1:210-527(-)
MQAELDVPGIEPAATSCAPRSGRPAALHSRLLAVPCRAAQRLTSSGRRYAAVTVCEAFHEVKFCCSDLWMDYACESRPPQVFECLVRLLHTTVPSPVFGIVSLNT